MKNRLNVLKWLNIFLLVINISALAAFMFMNRSGNSATSDQYSSDEFLRDRLKLTNEQYKKIIEMDEEVFRNYQLLIDIECESNFELIKQLSSEEASNDDIKKTLDKIGKYHALVKRQTVKHFQNIKSICTEEQKNELDQVLMEMMEAGDQCQYCNKANCARRNEIKSKKN
jgi:hypothetical protein